MYAIGHVRIDPEVGAVVARWHSQGECAQLSRGLRDQGLCHQLSHALDAITDEKKTERSDCFLRSVTHCLVMLYKMMRYHGLVLDEGDTVCSPRSFFFVLWSHRLSPPPLVIRGNLNTILSLTSPLSPSPMTHPSLRSPLDRSQLGVQGVRPSSSSALLLNASGYPRSEVQLEVK
jgi:ribosomal RNA-processing protein 12